MWNYVVPHFIDLPSSKSSKATYNILLHSQRGHGQSTLPSASEDQDKKSVTIPLLATDIANLLEALSIPTPVHSLIGVSQGGATALAFGGLYKTSKSIVVCDTAPRTPQGNKEAWEERIDLAQREGMSALANVTVPRWFPQGSICNEATSDSLIGKRRAQWVRRMVQKTNFAGFAAGARALSDYDLIDDGGGINILRSDVEHIMLVAGTLDGGGKVGKGLRDLSAAWNAERTKVPAVFYKEINEAGHLPMIDSPEAFSAAVGRWLQNF